MYIRISMVTLACMIWGIAQAPAQAPTAADLQFFESKIRPVLAEHCYSCHSAEAKKQKGGLRLDFRDGLRKGGESGPALVPGKPDESLLIKAIRYTHDDLKMPPKGKLPAAVIADLEAWVSMGAPDPRDKAAPVKTAATWEEMLRTRRQWWSLQPVRKVEVPTAKNVPWSDHPVDRFLAAKLEQVGLQPGGPAEPRTLIRRLSLVLTGLPPSVAEVEEFVKAWDGASAKKQATLEAWVDRLLRSPHFGERWARHWMDVVRFSETHGNEWNYDVHHAWRYRDYLIRAFNDDVPYDAFLREHIAGDLLPPRWNKKEQFNEAVIGTAFYRFGEVNHDDCIGLPTLGYDILDNQIDTLSKAFQATTVACARCHDHKIDAVSMKDYYALLGILRSSRPVSHTIDGPEVNRAAIRQLRDLKEQIAQELHATWKRDVQLIDAQRLLSLKVEKTTWDDPLHVWHFMRNAPDFGAAWRQLTAEDLKKSPAHAPRDQDKDYVGFGINAVSGAASRPGFQWQAVPDVSFTGWQLEGHGLHDWREPQGDFTVALDGNRVINKMLPRGLYTHGVSQKLNGALRSPILTNDKKYISLQVMGGNRAAVRLVSNNCQLNYRNFKTLKSDEWHWVTFEIPKNSPGLRCYVELMTKFDNPKFPDQLGTLGGDVDNQRVPWQVAAADPHSFFGVRRIVLHDGPAPPKESARWARFFLDGPTPKNIDELADRYMELMRVLVSNRSTSDTIGTGVAWIDCMLRTQLLSNDIKASPRLERLVMQYRQMEKNLAVPRIVPGLADVDQGIEQPVFIRGDVNKPGEVWPRHLIAALIPPGKALAVKGSGRLSLANAMIDVANPLTARVMVNRIWHHVFGHGLVRTCDDFGRMGELPSHPELLDWLAMRFVEDGWSVKKMIRLLTTSHAFQMTGRAEAKAAEVDPLNRLLHHYPARRMEGEAIRDSILATSGRLDRTQFGLSVLPYRETANEDRRLFPGPLDGNGRRSIYIKVNLMEGARFLSAFDLPGGKVCQGRRDVTNVPAQALAMLNDPFVVQQAEVWAKRLVQRPAETTAARIEHMFQAALGRMPAKDELERLVSFVEKVAETRQVTATERMTSLALWQDAAHALFNVQEFVYIP